MFTGIVEVGTITHATESGGDLRIHVQADIVTRTPLPATPKVSGCCPLSALTGSGFETELSKETVADCSR